jgi:hypothetical protein
MEYFSLIVRYDVKWQFYAKLKLGMFEEMCHSTHISNISQLIFVIEVPCASFEVGTKII